MSTPAQNLIAASVRTFFRALLTGDRDLLASVSLPHAELGTLVPTRPPIATVTPMLSEIGRLQLTCDALPSDRHLVRAFFGGILHTLVAQTTPMGPRIDLRYLIAMHAADDARRQVARAFYRALLLGDAATLFDLSFDARGVELLVDGEPPAGERAQLEHIAAAMGLIELAVGEPFVVPNGVQFVDARHIEMGIAVFSGLTTNGEIPFLLRQRDGAWKVIPFHFIQSASLTRGATLTP